MAGRATDRGHLIIAIQRVAASLIFFAAGLLSGWTHAGEIRICNEGAELKRVSLVERSGLGLLFDNWNAHGRYEVLSGECTSFFKESTDATVAYINVLVPDGKGGLRDAIYPGPNNEGGVADFYYGRWTFCMNPNGPFDFQGSERQLEICRPGTEKRVFSIYVSVETYGRATLKLD